MALDLLKYHTNPAELFGVTVTDGCLFNIGELNGKQIWITSLKYESKLNWNKAVEYCHNLTIDGYTDFRLPSKEELMFIHENKDALKMVLDNQNGQFKIPVTHEYWSSTEYKTREAWYRSMGKKGSGINSKLCEFNVRAVRSV